MRQFLWDFAIYLGALIALFIAAQSLDFYLMGAG